jgi:hypothetical protein
MNVPVLPRSQPELTLAKPSLGNDENILTPAALDFLDEFLTLPAYEQLND